MKKINPGYNLNIDWEKLFGDWSYYFKDFLTTTYIHNIFVFLNEVYKSNLKLVAPINKKDIFKSFRLTQMKDLKVVILGNGMYDNIKANGIAFSNNDISTKSLSHSLNVIQDNVERTIYNGLNLDFDITLESWCNQGVLMLNTYLTSEFTKSNSHAKYWAPFIKTTLQVISETQTGIIFVLLGDNAKKYKEVINKSYHFIIEGSDPKLIADKGEQWEDDIFNNINKIIKEQNGEEFCIDW